MMALRPGKITPWLVSAVLAVGAGLIQFGADSQDSINDNFLDNFLFDFTLAQNSVLRLHESRIEEHKVIVIALDEKTYRDREIKEQGVRALVPKFADLIKGLVEAGAEAASAAFEKALADGATAEEAFAAADSEALKAIGIDYVFSYPAAYLEEGAEGPLRKQIRDNRDILVLGRGEKDDAQHRFYRLLGDQERVAAIDVKSDSDNVFRRVPTRIEIHSDTPQKAFIKTLSGVLLEHVLAPTEIPDSILLAPEKRLEEIPTYSLIDVVNCYKNGNLKEIQDVIAGKIVLIARTMKGDDQKLTSDRFMRHLGDATAQNETATQGCQLTSVDEPGSGSSTVPGVYLHAAAVDTVLRNRVTSINPKYRQVALAVITVFAAAWAGFLLGPWAGFLVAAVGVLVLHSIASTLLANLYWMPTAVVAVCMLVSTSICYAFRYVFVDGQKRLIQRSFSTYLSPRLVQKFLDTGEEPKLDGEEKEITIMFADLSGFTKMSEEIETEKLVALTNEYLEVITEEVVTTGGYVDKFIGDAVMALWGAPADSHSHAINAVYAGIGISKKIREKQETACAAGNPEFGIKIGINTGKAVVGNVGAGGRLNYTAVGRTVNIAARLENVPKTYGCPVVLSEETAKEVGSEFLLNEIDRITVRGKKTPLLIYQPLCKKEEAGEDEKLYCEQYAEALQYFREGDFVKAAELWETLYAKLLKTSGDRSDFEPAKAMAQKARKCLQSSAETGEI